MTTIQSELSKFATQTAADMGASLLSGLKAMDDEPGEVAANLTAAGTPCTEADVRAWVRAQIEAQ